MSTDRRIPIRWAIAAILAALALALILLATRAEAQNYEDIGKALETHRWPSWLSIDDDWRFPLIAGKRYACFTDRKTGAQWATWGSPTAITTLIMTGSYPFGDGVPTVAEDYTACGFMPPVTMQPMAYAVDGKVYRGIVHTGPPYTKTSPLDWASMDADFAAPIAMFAGQACGRVLLDDETVTGLSDPKVGWYYVAPLGIVRCRIQ